MHTPNSQTEFIQKILSGARWVLILRASAQILTWLSTIIVVRFISPEDYGINAMLETPMELMLLLSTIGLDLAIVQSKTLKDQGLQSAFGWLIAINSLLFVAYFFGASAIADYFNEPRLELLAKTLSCVFLLVPFRVIPNALLDRGLKFKAKAVVDLIAAVMASITTLVMAYHGAGVWALVTGIILNRVVAAILLMWLHPWFIRPTLGPDAIQMMTFGGILTLSGFFLVLGGKLANLMAGPILGAHQLGIYTVAMQFALLPLTKAMPVLNPVLFPAFSRLQGQPEQAGDYLAKTLGVVSMFLFPIMFGMACTSTEFTAVVLGDKWGHVATPLALISMVVPFRMITVLTRPVMNGMGRPDLTLKSCLMGLMLLLPIIPVFMQYGVIGLAVAVMVTEPIVAISILYMSRKVLSISASGVMLRLFPAIAASFAMAVAVLSARSALKGPPSLVLLAEVGVGVATYVLILQIFFRTQFHNASQLLMGRR